MIRLTIESKCHEEWVPEWVPEVGSRAYVTAAELFETMECRPGKSEPGDRPIEKKVRRRAYEFRPSTPRPNRLHILQIIQHRRERKERIPKVHLQGTSCRISRLTKKGKLRMMLVVPKKEFGEVLDADYMLCCDHCLTQYGANDKLRP